MQKVIFLNQAGHVEPDISQDSAGQLKICLTGWPEPLEDFIRVFNNKGEAEPDPDSEVPVDNVIRPRIRQWSGDVFKEALTRLVENPSHKQLDLFQEAVGPLYENRLGIDLFVLLFRAILDGMPDISVLHRNNDGRCFYRSLFAVCMVRQSVLDAFHNVEFNV